MPAPGGGEVIDNDIINVASVKMQTHCDDGATNFCVDGDLGDFGDFGDFGDQTENDIDDENSGGGDGAVEEMA